MKPIFIFIFFIISINIFSQKLLIQNKYRDISIYDIQTKKETKLFHSSNNILVGYNLAQNSIIIFLRTPDNIIIEKNIEYRNYNESKDYIYFNDTIINGNLKIIYKHYGKQTLILKKDTVFYKFSGGDDFMGLGWVYSGAHFPVFSTDSSSIIFQKIEHSFFGKEKLSLIEFKLNNKTIKKICKNCINGSYSNDSKFILFSNTNSFLKDFFIYDKKLNSKIFIGHFYNAFWL